MKLPKYSMGIGDRFAKQGKAQLAAMQAMRDGGVEVAPVWNKSHREHSIIHTTPASVRREADEAARALGWTSPYFVDADHINLKTVDAFLEPCDFFTLDVAEDIGRNAGEDEVQAFVQRHRSRAGKLTIPGIGTPFDITPAGIETIARKYLGAVREAGRIHRRIESAKGAGAFVTEVSMDETGDPQTPVELLFILAALADEKIPLQTIAPRFSGRFNKGVDYVGAPARFAGEFDQDLAVIAFAIREFGLPENLKLSVHSGSDKFSIYAPIRAAIQKWDAGLHLKTAGTTWLEELAALAAAGGEGVQIAREVYAGALARFDELCTPYSAVIDIDRKKLPAAAEVNAWSGERYAAALRHDPVCPSYNPHFRQLIHVGYKVAAEMGERYTQALEHFADAIAPSVTANVLERHLRRIFP